jgi:HlyD family secretion protein
VSVKNATGALLPGMTATLSFVTGEASDVLTVPSAALRFRPEGVSAGLTLRRAGGEVPDSARGRFAAQRTEAGAAAAGAAGQPRARPGTLWYLDAQGKPASTRVRTGLTDGSRTVVDGADLKEGMQVIVGASAAGAASTGSGAGSNPLQPQMGPRRFGG